TKELEARSDTTHTLHIERVNIDGELKIKGDELNRLKQREAELRETITSSANTIEDIKRKKSELTVEIETLERNIVDGEELMGRLAEDQAVLAGTKEAVSGEVTELKVGLASTKQKHHNLVGSIEAKRAEIEGLVELADRKADEIGRGIEEIKTKNEEVAESTVAIEALLSKKEEVKRDEILKEESLAEISASLKETSGELKRIKGELDSVQQQRGSLTVELKEFELKVENLRERTIEKYGVNIGEHSVDEGTKALDTEEIRARVEELREKIGKMGEVSLSALEEFNELDERYQFLITQQEDLTKSMESLRGAISRINRTTREKFKTTFEAINEEFKKNFPRFFRGGKAELRLSGEGDVLEGGVEIVAMPPGKKLQNITLLSGGEKALTATALIFSIFLIKPSPFCLLDEVDAPLDDANIDRFNGFVKEMSKKSQFILITHNKRSMEMVDTLFGITMEEPGVSKAVTVQL
ncbi:MAG: chromosome segregation protein SMC, partial [Deltaproteobacteria bacterium]|nr:chromosome segregation protein SMC [Deltaproteobacteria bacterium]